MYVRLPGGRLDPGGLIVPCELTGHVSGNYTEIILTNAQYKWIQWMPNDQLLTDDQVENG